MTESTAVKYENVEYTITPDGRSYILAGPKELLKFLEDKHDLLAFNHGDDPGIYRADVEIIERDSGPPDFDNDYVVSIRNQKLIRRYDEHIDLEKLDTAVERVLRLAREVAGLIRMEQDRRAIHAVEEYFVDHVFTCPNGSYKYVLYDDKARDDIEEATVLGFANSLTEARVDQTRWPNSVVYRYEVTDGVDTMKNGRLI